MAKDKLTNLYYFDDFKELAQKKIEDKSQNFILASCNISNFKYINNMYGYEKGDQLLEQMGRFFCDNNPNYVLGCRIHSDRFLILGQVNNRDEEHLKKILERMADEFTEKMSLFFPLASIHLNTGAYILKDSDTNISEIVDKTEIARKSAKDNYLTSVVFYDDVLEERAKAEREMIPLFERALKEERIAVFLQPKVAIASGELVGAEALVRLIDDDGKVVQPSAFIPILERTGMISKLDYYMVQKVCDIISDWIFRGIEPIRVSVNLSRLDFKEDGIWDSMLGLMGEYDVPRKYIEFEVTETIFYDDVKFIIDKIKQLRSQGYKVSMDDFGSGYSSLNTVGLMPIDIIKFDRGFVQNSINTQKGLEIMSGLVNIFSKLQMEVICEGVETKEEEKIIEACGCEYVQGYLHDRPLKASEFDEKYMKQRKSK